MFRVMLFGAGSSFQNISKIFLTIKIANKWIYTKKLIVYYLIVAADVLSDNKILRFSIQAKLQEYNHAFLY